MQMDSIINIHTGRDTIPLAQEPLMTFKLQNGLILQHSSEEVIIYSNVRPPSVNTFI